MIMRTGVNYIPSGSWLHFWIDFDEERVRKDLENIKKIGADHIRAHLLWHYFQPNAGYMSTTCMKNLERFIALCEEYDIDFFSVTVYGIYERYVVRASVDNRRNEPRG